jgi:hypothetical protein
VLTMTLVLHADPDLDDEGMDQLARQLRNELIQLDVDSVTAANGTHSAAGAKGDPVTLGALIVALSATGGVFTTLIGTLRDWLNNHSRGHRISVTIDGDTIEVERGSAEQQQALIEAFIRRHSEDQGVG